MLIERTEDMTDCFEYELTPEPTSLFKDGLMRKPNKAQLGRTLITESSISSKVNDDTSYVIDGGALLHRVCWNLPATFVKVADQYCAYVLKKYGKRVCIVFDGYKSSTKDHEHQRRGKRFPDIVVKAKTQVNCKQTDFLSNNSNKTAFIKLLSSRLRSSGHTVEVCEGDADRDIVMKGLELAENGKESTVVADDTDILIMLVFFWNATMSNIFLRHEARKSIKKDLEIISIEDIVSHIPKHVKENLLFIHAWGGCDTNSATFGQGKIATLKLIESNRDFAENVCSVFKDCFASKNQVSNAGIQVAMKLYGNFIKDHEKSFLKP